MLAVITGATGLLGRHLAAEFSRQGWSIASIVRHTSNRSHLNLPGLQFHVCDLSQNTPEPEIFRHADVVIHTAAAVTDWAPWTCFVANTIDATQNVCRGMIAVGCRRLVHISTVGVYGRPRLTEPLREDCPYASIGRWDYYTNSKIQAEQIVWGHQHDRSLDVTVIRPAMLYGPGDRGLIGRVIPLCQQRKLALVGNPQTLLPLVNVQDVVDALVRAAMSSSAIGEAFNVVNPEPVTQIDFFNTVAALVGASPVRRRVPYRLAYAAGLAAEIIAHVRKSERPPMITRYRVSLFGHPRIYSTDKIQSKLGWEPKISFREGIQQAVRWHLTQEHGSR